MVDFPAMFETPSPAGPSLSPPQLRRGEGFRTARRGLKGPRPASSEPKTQHDMENPLEIRT